MNTLALLQALDLGLMLASRVPAILIQLQAVRDEVAAMVAEGRDPTREEFAAVSASIDDRLARLKILQEQGSLPPPVT